MIRAALFSCFLWLAPPAEATQYYVVLGDSLDCYVAGGQARDLSWQIVSNERDVMFRNLSLPGVKLEYYTDTAGIAALDRACGWNAINCDGVIVSAGLNSYSFGTSWPAYVNALNALVAWGRARQRPVILMDIPYEGPENVANTAGKTLGDYRALRYFTALNNPDTVKFWTRPAALDHDAPSLYGPDHVHLNAAGQAVKARSWIETAAAQAGLF